MKKPKVPSTKQSCEQARADRALFSSLLKHVVRAAPNEDATDFVLEAIGRNVGADRCYVYRFWDPGKTSMCTNTHEWCADGVKPEIGGQQTCNLATLTEFNAQIMSGRDFLFTDINAIDAGSREWLAPQGIQSLIATPLVGADNTVCGFAGFDFVKAPCPEFTERIIVNIHEAADILLTCRRLYERDVALRDIDRKESEYEVDGRELDRTLSTLQSDVRIMHPKQMLEIVRSRLDADLCYMVQDIRADGSGSVLPEHVLTRDGWTNTQGWNIPAEMGRAFDMRLMAGASVTLHVAEVDWVKSNMAKDEFSPDSVASLKTIHLVGVRQEGNLVNMLCVGYADGRMLTANQVSFLRRSALVIMSSLERIATYHDLAVALSLAHLKGDIVEFMFAHHSFEEIRNFVAEKICEVSGVQHLMFCADDGTRRDWFGEDAPSCCHDCVQAAVNFGRGLPTELFSAKETVIVPVGAPLPNMNLPRYCPMRSSVASQIKRGENGWWRLVADYTKPHKFNLAEVGRGMRESLELLTIAYDRERHAETISRQQKHLRYRADMLTYALSKDDLPGLIDATLHRLLELTACDYIAIHTIEGDHRLLYPGGELEKCPERCADCAFYKFNLPPVENPDHIIALPAAQEQTVAPLSPQCPVKSLEVIVVYCEGKPWGGIALHYTKARHEISEDVRRTLRSAADVLTLALERHAAAIRLQAERDRVVEAEKARSYFFSAVSHDIRTPLNAIIGFSELLQGGNVSPEDSAQYLKMIVASGKTLLQLVNDVLDLSKMDLGRFEFSPEPTDVGELVREILPVFQTTMKSKEQTLVMDIPDLPRLMIDPHRFRQVLFNFVSNAVKYAGPCTIRVSVAYEGGILKLSVRDNGKGLPAEKAKRLMQPFVQADIKNRAEGCGLGLAICKRLAEIVNGTISIETALGKGFAIRTEVPVEVAQGEEKVETAAAPSAADVPNLPRRVLVVDDSPVNRVVLKAVLNRVGITNVELAEDGKVALERLQKDSAFDLIMSDMWMPVMDGAELVKNIRADARIAHLKVCALTADVEARTSYKDQGFDYLLLKPVTINEMLEVLKNIK